MGVEPFRVRVLLFEEDPMERLLLREYLETSRFQILETQGTPQAFSTPLLGVSIVLLDMDGTQVDGVNLILDIRRRNPNVPILGMTDRQADLYNDPRLRGCSIAFIQKPFSVRRLHRSLAAALKKAHAARTLLRAGPEKGFLRTLPAATRGAP